MNEAEVHADEAPQSEHVTRIPTGRMQTTMGAICCLAGSLVVLGLTGFPAEEPAHPPGVERTESPVRPAGTAHQEQDQLSLGEQTFKQQCAPCHGDKGKGDGPASVAFNPRPADFTDPETIAKMTDDEVVEVVTKGRNSMPSFGPVLGEEVIRAVVAYIRVLSQGTDR